MRDVGFVGRVLLAVGVLAFGVQHLVYAGRGAGLGPPWTPEGRALVCIVGVVLLIAGAAMAAGKQVWVAAMAVSAVAFVRVVLFYVPRLMHTPRDPGPWTSAFELLALCGACLILAASAAWGRAGGGHVGYVLFAASLVVFGVQHMMYGPFVATLIPAWIPGRLFWAYFVGAAFFAAALAIVSGKMAALAGKLLGGMFLLWVVILHAPRVVGAPHSGDEWTSLFVALAMGGSGLVIAAAMGSGAETKV